MKKSGSYFIVIALIVLLGSVGFAVYNKTTQQAPQLTPECGNGIIEPGEQCEGDASNCKILFGRPAQGSSYICTDCQCQSTPPRGCNCPVQAGIYNPNPPSGAISVQMLADPCPSASSQNQCSEQKCVILATIAVNHSQPSPNGPIPGGISFPTLPGYFAYECSWS